MKRHSESRRGLRRPQRFGVGLIGAMIIATGAMALAQGHPHYRNAWGLAVFAPFAFVVGLLAFVLAFRLGPRR